MAIAPTGVGTLTEGARSHMIEIRVVRKWRPRQKSQDTCYIFIDKEGDVIQGFCAAKDQMTVDIKLLAKRCYQIKGYACTGVEKTTKVIPNPVGIRMGVATSIVSITDNPSIPMNYFCFGDFNDIRDMFMGTDKIIDYIGILEAVEDRKTKRQSKSFTNLKITDTSNETFYITIWDEIANLYERFSRTALQRAKKPSVVAATSLRFNQYWGRMDLQSTAATHVYLNPDHPEAKQLLESYNPTLIKEDKQLALLAASAEKITIAELLLKEHPIPPEKNFMSEAFVDEFITNEGWYYTGCMKCKNTAHRSGDIWFCTDCGDINEVTYKSQIVVLISDGLSKLKVAMFDDTIAVLLDKPLHDIIVKDGYEDNTCLPEPLIKIRGVRKFFVLKPQREQYANTPKFIVKEILSLEYFAKPLALEPPPIETPRPQTQATELHYLSNTPPPTTPKTDLSKSSDTPPPKTPTIPLGSQTKQSPQCVDPVSKATDPTAKRKLDFGAGGQTNTSSPISDTKHIRYKE